MTEATGVQLGAQENDVDLSTGVDFDLEEVDFVSYQTELSFFGLLTGVFSEASFNIGKGLGSILLEKSNKLMLI